MNIPEYHPNIVFLKQHQRNVSQLIIMTWCTFNSLNLNHLEFISTHHYNYSWVSNKSGSWNKSGARKK